MYLWITVPPGTDNTLRMILPKEDKERIIREDHNGRLVGHL